MPKTVTLRIMRYLGDGPNARPYKVVVMRRFMDEHRNQVALIGFLTHGTTPATDNLALEFTMVVPIAQLSELP
jgi:hypothetical protein